MKTIGLISANYVSSRFGVLTNNRTLASLPFGGRYRLIDFALSNMVNSGITTVGIISPYNSGSLIDHVGIGKPWSLGRKMGGLFIMPGSVYGLHAVGNRFLLRDIIQNKTYLERDDADYVVVSGSSDVVNIDYAPLIEQHSKSGKAITMVYKRVEEAEKYTGFFMDLDEEDGKVVEIMSEDEGEACYFMDCFIADREFMLDFIEWFDALEYMDFFDVIRRNIDKFDIGSYEFTGSLGKINNIEDYLRVNMRIRDYDFRNEVFCNPERIIYTKVQDEAPVYYSSKANVTNSVIAAGSRIEGTVENSTIFRSVNVGKGAKLKNCVVMMHTEIGEGASLENVICDKYVTIRPGTRISGRKEEPIVIGKGLTL